MRPAEGYVVRVGLHQQIYIYLAVLYQKQRSKPAQNVAKIVLWEKVDDSPLFLESNNPMMGGIGQLIRQKIQNLFMAHAIK